MLEEKKERRHRKRVESDSREDPYASENSDPGVPKALFDARTAAKKSRRQRKFGPLDAREEREPRGGEYPDSNVPGD